jgi:hypothetical protein
MLTSPPAKLEWRTVTRPRTLTAVLRLGARHFAAHIETQLEYLLLIELCRELLVEIKLARYDANLRLQRDLLCGVCLPAREDGRR